MTNKQNLINYRELFFRYNPWWEKEYTLTDIRERPLFLDLLKEQVAQNIITFVTGLRRIGKTTMIKLLINHLIKEQNINPRSIFYISLDDYLISSESLISLIDEYRKIHKIPFQQKVFIFFDEITYQENFELQLKNIFDQQNVKIFASSSSASLMKSKKPYLTGRSHLIEILPLNFDEYLDFKKIVILEADQHLRASYFEEFLQIGGIPEYVLHENMEYLKELVDDILYKDICSLHNVKNSDLIKDFFLLLMERSGKVISINKIANILDISPDTAKRYLILFIDSYLIYSIPKFGKTNDRILSAKKLYAADLGIRNLFTGFRDKGSLFENYVYLNIKHKNPRYVYQNEQEIDFMTDDGTLIEVKYGREMSDKQLKLFENTPAKKKVAIQNIYDLEKFLANE